MTIFKFKLVLILLFVLALAFLLRFYNLGANPPSLDWDEASLGWNAYSILKTGSDEYGNRFPVSIRSFNDYKPPLYVYTTIPSIAIFGLNEFSVRLPSAIFGILTILLTYFLVVELTRFGKIKANYKLALLAAFFLAITPWHINFSRVAFEANLSLFYFVGGVTGLTIFFNRKRTFWLLLCVTSFVLAAYSYHSARLVIPLFLFIIFFFYKNIFFENKTKVFWSILLGLALLFPLIISTLHSGSLQARFQTVSIFSATGLHDLVNDKLDVEKASFAGDKQNGEFFWKLAHWKWLTLGQIFAKDYLDHWNFNFLFLSGDSNSRHHAPDVGMMGLWMFPLILTGLYVIARDKPSWWPLIIIWYLAAPVASALTTETPHAVRSLLTLPTYQIFAALGTLEIYKRIVRYKYARLVFISFVVIVTVGTFYYLHQYFIHMPVEYASGWQYGYKEMITKVKKIQDKYDKVYVTSAYDQPYIYFLFYGGFSPNLKNNGYLYGQIGKYKFVNFGMMGNEEKNSIRSNSLVILAPGDPFPKIKVLDTVKYPDESDAFQIGVKEI